MVYLQFFYAEAEFVNKQALYANVENFVKKWKTFVEKHIDSCGTIAYSIIALVFNP